MIMQIIGWAILALFLGKYSLTYLLIMANGLGRYSIGGDTNKFIKKFFLLIGFFVILGLWYLLFINFPYSFNMTPKN